MATPSFFSSLIRLRVLPLLIVSCVALFGIKTYDIVNGGQELSNMLLASQAHAVTKDEEEDETEEAEAEADAEEAEEEVAAEEGGDGKAKEPTEYKNGEAISEEEARKKQFRGGKQSQFSQIELDILQSLAERREKLDTWESEIQMKENLLEATESRIEQKIAEITDLEKRVQGILNEYNQHETRKIKSLVKIYESMKPGDAARIFNELELPVLLMVIDQMSERKAAPIIAKMDPLKAKRLTVELSEYRQIQDVSADVLSR